MKHTALSLLVAAACATVLTGCARGSGDTADTPPPVSHRESGATAAAGDRHEGTTAPGTDAQPERTAAQPVDPCEAIADCTYIGQADVDGDGTLDQIGLVFAPAATAGPSTGALRVAADGTVHELSVEYSTLVQSVDDFYTGAFHLSRAEGTDLVLHARPGGGNAEKFYVATWQDGTLAWLPPFEQTRSGAEPDGWFLQSSHGSVNEIGCKGGGVASFETLYAPTMEGMPQPNGDTRDIQQYTRTRDRWVKGALENVPDPNGWDMHWEASSGAFQCSDETLPPT